MMSPRIAYASLVVRRSRRHRQLELARSRRVPDADDEPPDVDVLTRHVYGAASSRCSARVHRAARGRLQRSAAFYPQRVRCRPDSRSPGRVASREAAIAAAFAGEPAEDL
jgi:hypothetical protein